MLQNRPPIIVILGHVDHGKTTLLDYLRKTNIASREAGGITQHIRSFQYQTPGGETLTFIDTPGHAIFSQMRSRGSQIADLAILVVAGGDGVMPQTKESIQFITQAKLPFIVAITKSDLPTFDADQVKTQLAGVEVMVEDFGGQVPAVSVSAKTGTGVPDLLELISLVTSLNPPQADPAASPLALVLESRLDNHKGPLATVIVKAGTLSPGTPLFLDDKPLGKIRALVNFTGQTLTSAPPSTPVEILGLSEVPPVAALLTALPQAPAAVHSPAPSSPVSDTDQLRLILRTDVAGSLEAILASLPSAVKVVLAQTGDASEGDVLLARTSKARIMTFNSKIPGSVAKLAEIEKVPVASFTIIYELLEAVDKILHPVSTEVITGKAAISAEFKFNSDRIAGCKCLEGQFEKKDLLKIFRGDQLLGTTRFKSLHQGKNTIDKVRSGTEFGASFSPYLDFKPGDNIIAYAV